MHPSEKRRCLKAIKLFKRVCAELPSGHRVCPWEVEKFTGGTILGRAVPEVYLLFIEGGPMALQGLEFYGFTKEAQWSLEVQNMSLQEDDLLPPNWLYFANWSDDGFYFFNVPDGPPSVDLPVLRMDTGDWGNANQVAPSFQLWLLDLAAKFAGEIEARMTQALDELAKLRLSYGGIKRIESK